MKKDGSCRYILGVKEFLEWSITNDQPTNKLHPIQHDTYTKFKKSLLKLDKKTGKWLHSDDRCINMYNIYRLDGSVSMVKVVTFLEERNCILLRGDM